jgi:hypothetical protein
MDHPASEKAVNDQFAPLMPFSADRQRRTTKICSAKNET